MKITCKVCKTTKTIREDKLEPFRGKTISTKCANKQCTHRVKFKVPLLTEKSVEPKVTKPKAAKPKQTTIIPKKASKPASRTKKQLACPNCQTEILKNAKYCPECGSKISMSPNPDKPIENQCHNCGRIYEKEAKYCLECGTPLAIKKAMLEPPPPIQETNYTSIKPKKKSGFWSIFWKATIALVIIAVVAVGAFYVINDNSFELDRNIFELDDNNEELVLSDGPWIMNASPDKILFDGYNDKKLKEAIALSNVEYKSTLFSSSIDVPISAIFDDATAEELYFNQFNPTKKGNFYVFSINSETTGEGEVKIILDLKSNDYFEGKGFYSLDYHVSTAFIKGRLKK